jgi:hypothetical protein
LQLPLPASSIQVQRRSIAASRRSRTCRPIIFQTTDPNTNQLTGTPNTRVPITAGATQTFLVAFTPNDFFPVAQVYLGYACDHTDAVIPIVGVNTLALTFDLNDMIAIGVTPSNDDYSHTGGPSGTGIFVISAINIGASANLIAKIGLPNQSLPLTATLCQTDPITGQCLSPPSTGVEFSVGHDQSTTWTAFLSAHGDIPIDPAHNRAFFLFFDNINGNPGTLRGSTNIAVTTH